MIALLVFTDGRPDLIHRTLTSFDHMVVGPVTTRIIVDDSADSRFHAMLQERYPAYTITPPQAHKRGFCGAIQAGWAAVPETVQWVVHLEDDFLFNRMVYLEDMIETLEAFPYVVQMALKRQPWNTREIEAGDLFGVHPEGYEEVEGPRGPFVRQRMFFTTNPSLYHRRWLQYGWPDPPACEGRFTHQLIQDPNVHFGYWGRKTDKPWVHHIGDTRAGGGY